MVSARALDVVGDINPRTISIGGQPIVDADGKWVGPPDGLARTNGSRRSRWTTWTGGGRWTGTAQLAPQGRLVPVDLEDQKVGVAGGDGSPDTPGRVLAKVVQVDGNNSGLDSDRLDGISSEQFLRADVDDTTTGVLSAKRFKSVQRGDVLVELPWMNRQTFCGHRR